MVTVEQLHQALEVVRRATVEFVDHEFFVRGVLTRFDQWRGGLPNERESLAHAITHLAAQWGTGTGADVNGVALDEKGEPSLESLVLHYAELDQDLFPRPGVAAIREKLAVHGGPLYSGPWP